MMATKKELEDKMLKIEVECKIIKDEWARFSKFIGVLGYTLQEIYRCYPQVIGECCTEKELLRLFKVQSELTDFIRKIQQERQKEDEESEFDEF